MKKFIKNGKELIALSISQLGEESVADLSADFAAAGKTVIVCK